ncbi:MULTISPECIES: DUF2301 domain-containing membrane protein [Planktothrix]|jgi:uncharacterized integral membrane protein|uniref:DUF2301 domain-containing membrane protein n=2 Tax=Planktothrix TaxID=54304 RepID=A0A479ZT02_PLAAG|nr:MULTISPECIES: DUF2301 domain-containing membrane protein [Planktothrix]CAD5961207.1 hypothetical protein NO108_03554 [Planktothrix rubescens]CAC5343658.1 conserved membrane hypothetical protein [Planktothrix rubescens NIVA-CYA 18]CAD0225299.1 conserved membrane hypothetical protein [Planktothrix agardhii]CAD5918637.1 hypothetical protein NO758_00511 [Planktothrix agardhii]CAD5980341.1 hypothetical protein PCC7821_04599 [Planktothrix rubescens NIVA-CYA 18]
MVQTQQDSIPVIYQGQFGNYTINDHDRQSVIIYRTGIIIAALCFTVATGLVLFQLNTPGVLQALTPIYFCFWLGLGVSLFTIHIYLIQLHQLLELFWLIGGIASVVFAVVDAEPLALTIYHNPYSLFGVGFTFVALTGIYFKEAFCFNRVETKLLTPLVPILLLGFMAGLWSVDAQKILLAFWAIQFIIFAGRKIFQGIPGDIGDKSVFDYLKNQQLA